MSRIGFLDDFYDDKEKEKKPQEPEYTEKQIRTFEQEIEEARKNLYVSPRLVQMMDDSWNAGVVVHDFLDDYHMPEEEKIKKNQFYKQFRKLNNWKRVHKKIDSFIECARDSISCLIEVAKENTVYSPEKFIKLVMRGKINVAGWFYPKYKGRDRKDYDWKYLNEFILSDEPLENLSRKQNITEADRHTEEELLEMSDRFFTKEELEYYMRPMTDEEKYRYEIRPFDEEKDEHIAEEAESNIVVETSYKQSRKFLKDHPEVMDAIKDRQRSARSVSNLRYASDFRHDDDMDIIAEFDRKFGYQSESDLPVFRGKDITKSSAYHKYMHDLEQYERTQIKYNDRGTYRTEEEMREVGIKEALDAAGWNIRKLYDNEKIEKKLKKASKRDRKREKELKRQLTKIQSRSEKRKEALTGGDYKKKKKKKKSDGGGGSSLRKKTKKKVNDFFDGYSDEYDSMKEYGKDVLDFRM